MMAVNVRGVFVASQEALRHMGDTAGGSSGSINCRARALRRRRALRPPKAAVSE